MCGIIGFLGNGFVENPSRALNMLQHRGPDDKGDFWQETTNGKLWLGHRRLYVIDLSPMGRQPMIDPQTGNVIIYNGEVYNFREIRRSMKQNGQRFKSDTDTEVILALFAKQGIHFVNNLRGMFVIVIWEAKRQRLWFIRDRMGIKPLYLYRGREGLAFASECRALKALLSSKDWKVNPLGMASYMTWGSVSEPYTLWQEIEMLPPASYACWNGQHWHQETYWKPDLGPNASITEEEAIQEIRRLLEESISLRTIADVSLGVFLSGGIDSSIIVALLSTLCVKVKTLNVAFAESGYDESSFANLMVERYQTEHKLVTLSRDELPFYVLQAVESLDQPSIDGVNTWIISRAARQAGLTVALSGLGGDELFYGYEGFRQIRSLRSWQWRLLAPVVGFLFWLRDDQKGRLKAILSAATDEYAFLWVRAFWSPEQLEKIGYVPHIEMLTNDLNNNISITNRYSYFELYHYMKNTLLRDTDVMSMAHSLEVRVPLIDYNLVEFVLQLPEKLKWGDYHTPKYLVVKAVEDLLPKEIIHRKKSGFTLPFDRWLRHELNADVEQSLHRLEARGLFPAGFVLQQWQDFLAGKQDWSRVWQFFILAQKL